MPPRHETCIEYFLRRLQEGWKCISFKYPKAVLLSPRGFKRELDLRNDVETLRPNGVGATTQLTPVGNAANWDCVDDDPSDEDATYVNMTLGGTKLDTYALPAHTGSGTINKVTFYIRAKVTDTNNEGIRWVVRTHAIDYYYDATAVSSYSTQPKELATNPNTTNPWTWTEIDNLEAGVEFNSRYVRSPDCRCTQVYVEVDYIEIPPSGDFPPEYILEGKAEDLRPNAPTGATINKVSQDFPLVLGRAGRAKELKSKVE